MPVDAKNANVSVRRSRVSAFSSRIQQRIVSNRYTERRLSGAAVVVRVVNDDFGVPEAEILVFVETGVLVHRAEVEHTPAERQRSLGKERAEALAASRERAEVGVELVCETAGR